MASSRTPEERVRRASTFNEDAELYDRARPTYPVELFDAVWRLADLGPNPNVVEVGCGTGQASVDLAKRGAKLTCVEFGDQMATLARKNLAEFPSATVEVSKFEDWDARGRTFALLFASAAWHWVDPVAGHVQAAKVLQPGGHIAIVSSEHCYPEGYDPVYGPIQQVYGEVTGSKMPWPPPLPEFRADRLDEGIEASGLFEPIASFSLIWHFERSADDYIALLGSYSDNRIRNADERGRLFAGIHRIISESSTGRISKHYLTRLRVARVKSYSN